MMIPSNYEVNVARKPEPGSLITGAGYHPRHFCKIELGQLLEAEARSKFDEITGRFPTEEGWSLSLKRVECFGTRIAESMTS